MTSPVKPLYHVVTIWHNVQQDHAGTPVGFFGYRTGHAMSPVFVYVAKCSTQTAGEAFKMFNAPEEYLSPEELAVTRRYHANRLRSLSIGDVVQAGGRFYACDRDGWKELPAGSLDVQPDPYESWSGTAEVELTRAHQDYARAVYGAALARNGDEGAAIQAYKAELER